MRGVKGRISEWIARYGPAELLGIAGTYLGFWAVMAITQSLPASGYGAAMGENLGFYGFIFAKEWRTSGDPPARILPRMLMEFGAAEALDFLVIRPGATVLGVHLLGEGWGVLAGKLVADLIFYTLAITIYERMRRGAEDQA